MLILARCCASFGLVSRQNQPSPPAQLPRFIRFRRRRCAWTTSTRGGPASRETVALDRVVNDGPWAGSRTQLVDPTNLGKYLFEVRDKQATALLYSRGFASIYGEWETTAEVKTAHRTFHESLRFPWPNQPVA